MFVEVTPSIVAPSAAALFEIVPFGSVFPCEAKVSSILWNERAFSCRRARIARPIIPATPNKPTTMPIAAAIPGFKALVVLLLNSPESACDPAPLDPALVAEGAEGVEDCFEEEVDGGSVALELPAVEKDLVVASPEAAVVVDAVELETGV